MFTSYKAVGEGEKNGTITLEVKSDATSEKIEQNKNKLDARGQGNGLVQTEEQTKKNERIEQGKNKLESKMSR